MVTTTKYGKDVSPAIQKSPLPIAKVEYGVPFPVGADPTRPFFHKITGRKKILNGVHQIIGTTRGERVMLPNFGCNLKPYLFQPLDEITFNEIRREVLESITLYAPGVKILKLGVFEDSQYSPTGGHGLIVKLLLQLKDEEDLIIETEVKIA